MAAVPAYAVELMTTGEAANLLKKMVAAARLQNYSGIYLYQHADVLESFRLFHQFDANGEQERRESLDGFPREFVRNNDQIIGYLPGAKPMALDRRAANKFFPGVIQDQATDVLNNYLFKRVGTERVANYDCQMILLEPKDRLRHPHRMCVEPSSGLLLKSTMYGPDRLEQLEQFTFVQLDIGGAIDKQALKSVFAAKSLPADPPVKNNGSANTASTDLARFDTNNLPSGFRLVKEVHSQLPGKTVPVMHFLYSDGMATVSVFVEPASNAPVNLPLVQGTVNFFSRQVDGWRITALGEVPLQTVQMFTLAFSPR